MGLGDIWYQHLYTIKYHTYIGYTLVITSFLHFQRKADEQVSSSHESAFAIAAVAVGLWLEYPDVGELLMAHLQAFCPYILPFYPPRLPNQSSTDYHRLVLACCRSIPTSPQTALSRLPQVGTVHLPSQSSTDDHRLVLCMSPTSRPLMTTGWSCACPQPVVHWRPQVGTVHVPSQSSTDDRRLVLCMLSFLLSLIQLGILHTLVPTGNFVYCLIHLELLQPTLI